MYAFIGAIIGYFLGNSFWTGLLGFFVGSLFDNRRRAKSRAKVATHYSQSDFTQILLIFTSYVIKSDGNKMKTSELNYIKQYLIRNFSIEKSKDMLLSLKNILEQDVDILQTCNSFRDNASIHEKLYVIQFLFGLATTDGMLSPSEIAAILFVSDSIGVNRSDFESIKAMYIIFNSGNYQYQNRNYTYEASISNSLDNDYKILEIEPSATDEEVKKTYRSLAMKYHPDKVNHLGDEIRKNAEEKFSKLNQAYERIKKSRGIN